MPSSKKILITGGAGFIGSHLSTSLLQEGHEVVAVDNFDPFYARTLKEENLALNSNNPNFRFLEGDIRDDDLYRRLEDTFLPDATIHLAALAGVQPSIQNAALYWEVNILGTQKLYSWLAKRNPSPVVVFASSSSVYGNSEITPLVESASVDHPISPYAATKKAGELLSHTAYHLQNFRIACLRFFTVYGPRQRPDLAIRKFSELMLKQAPIPLFGDGSTYRDYTHVSDIVSGITKCLNHLLAQTDPFYDIFNLGRGQPLKLLEMVHLLEEGFGIIAEKKFLPLQAGDVTGTYADIEKATRTFQYRPQMTHAAGFASVVNWLKTKKGN
jgi:UDP-glucuronate 4-epimerase